MKNIFLILGGLGLGYTWLNTQKKTAETISFQLIDFALNFPHGYKVKLRFNNPTGNEILLDYVNLDLSYQGRMFTKLNKTGIEIEPGINEYWIDGQLNLLSIGQIVPGLINDIKNKNRSIIIDVNVFVKWKLFSFTKKESFKLV